MVALFTIAPLRSLAAALPVINAESVLAYTNVERYRQGLPFLNSNQILSKLAKDKMVDLFANQYFAHESLSGKTISDFAKQAGYEYILVGENLALGNFETSREVVTAWMNSPGHRKNILSDTYTEIGIAAGRSVYEGRSVWIVVQSFGMPKTVCPAIDKILEQKIKSLDQKLNILKVIADMREKDALRKSGTMEERQVRVASYNTAARLYNENVEVYKDYIEKYNEGIGEFNECVKEVRDHLDTTKE